LKDVTEKKIAFLKERKIFALIVEYKARKILDIKNRKRRCSVRGNMKK